MGAAIFQINNLNAWYQPDKPVLSDFSIELKEHEAVGLIGLNGAGKTTFLKIVSGSVLFIFCLQEKNAECRFADTGVSF